MSPRLTLHFLGPPQLVLDNVPMAVERRKVVALLAYLALERGQQRRELLSTLLWPNYDQSKAFTNLRHTLWEIQQSMGDGWLLTDREKISLNEQADIWLDVRQFESLITQSRTQNDISLRIPLLLESTKFYRDHFLAGFSLKDAPNFNEWAFAKSEDLRCQLADVLIHLSEDYCALGQAEKAIPYARRIVALDPFDESAHRRLMTVYWQAGQHSAALKQYQVCEETLRKELNLDPQPETYALYKQIRKGELKPPVAKPVEAEPINVFDTKAPNTHQLTKPSPFKPMKLLSSRLFMGLIFLIVTSFVTFYSRDSIQSFFTPNPAIFTQTPEVYNPQPDPSDYFDAKGVPMRLVPAGRFGMGFDSGQADEKPVHEVYLDAFYIDKYEVTNTLYKACVDSGTCAPPQITASSTRPNYYGSAEFDNFPVIYVDWNRAKTYCEWRNSKLPNEAQWEKAARGTDNRLYPGGANLDRTLANYENFSGDTTAIGNYKDSMSPYGVYDMAGNVWEWVADWYSDTYYQKSPSSNPLGPEAGQYRVLRGGAWISYRPFLRSTERAASVASTFTSSIGFRCAQAVNP